MHHNEPLIDLTEEHCDSVTQNHYDAPPPAPEDLPALNHSASKCDHSACNHNAQCRALTRGKVKTSQPALPASWWLKGAELDLDKMATAQRADPTLGPIWEWLLAKKKPDFAEI